MQQIFGYIYLIKNLINGKMYFGITENDFHERYGGNIAKHTHNKHLKRSIEKYGINNFEIIEQFDVAYNQEDLWDLEDMYMCIYNTLDPKYGYNKKRSGSKYKGNGKHTEESKKKNSETIKKKYENGYVNPRKGKTHTDEAKRKNSEAHKGEKHPMYGTHKSEETKKKIGDAQKGAKNHMYGKTGEKHHLYGTHISEEQKQIIRERQSKKVGQYTLDGELVAVYESAKHAAQTVQRDHSSICSCCRGKKKTCGGFKWKYID